MLTCNGYCQKIFPRLSPLAFEPRQHVRLGRGHLPQPVRGPRSGGERVGRRHRRQTRVRQRRSDRVARRSLSVRASANRQAIDRPEFGARREVRERAGRRLVRAAEGVAQKEKRCFVST